jgi:N-glycosidase YbiA
LSIKFFKTKETYGCFSNFSRHAIYLDERQWATTEHYYQAQKFIGAIHYDHIAKAETPRIAADLGRNTGFPIRADWEQVKVEIMKKCVRAKVLQHPQIKKLLLETGDEELIENSPYDSFWGCGKDGSGYNMLGKILMEIRTELRMSITSL